MNTFTIIFLLLLAAAVGIQLWLAGRQLRHVAHNRDRVPEAFRERIELPAHRKAADYTIAKTRFERLDVVVGALLLLAWTLGGGLQLLDGLWHGAGLPSLWTGTGFVVSTFLLMGLLELPLTAYRTFALEQHFGFNRTTPTLFMADTLKQAALMVLIGTPLTFVVLWLMENAGALWWFDVWLVWAGFSLLMIWAYPAFIAPLFNKFSPLEDEALAERIRALLQRAGFSSRGLYVMDGSRRSSHGNAYFTGLGKNKRIVFFDTLLGGLAPEEVEAVLAHELGHFRRNHVRKRLTIMMGASLAGLALLGWLIGRPWFYAGLGVHTPSLHVALVLFLMVVPVFTFFIQPLMAQFSRRHEYEADDYAAELASGPALIRALVKLYTENASTLTPDPLYSAFHDSHPPAPLRVAHLSARLH
jgi:STE24 endopeptidase